MADVVVTVPKGRWAEWLSEGDLADGTGMPAGWAGDHEYGFTLGPGLAIPKIVPSERVYIVAHGRLRGYAPLESIDPDATRFGGRAGSFALVRRGAAVAVTIAEPVRGFQGWRYRWWNRADEVVFSDWQQTTEGSGR